MASKKSQPQTWRKAKDVQVGDLVWMTMSSEMREATGTKIGQDGWRMLKEVATKETSANVNNMYVLSSSDGYNTVDAGNCYVEGQYQI